MSDDKNTIWVSSGVSHRTGEGFVTVAFGKAQGQLDVSAARQFALNVIEAATAAELDAVLVKTLRDKFDLSLQTIGGLLTDLREQRIGSRVVSARASVETETPEEETRP